MNRAWQTSRRSLMQAGAAVTFGLAQSQWMQSFATEATTNKQRKKAVIVLWLSGGPATIDLWDLKPGHENGGPYKEIETSVPGLRISEHLPNLAQHGQDLAIIRSMASKEGDHGRATFLGMTGYIPQGAIKFPVIGSLVSKELGDEASDLPNFVSVSPRRNGGALGGGFLGPRYSPLIVGGGGRGQSPDADLRVPDLSRPNDTSEQSHRDRLDLLEQMETGFDAGKDSRVVETIQSATARAKQLMRPDAAAAFNLEQEDEKLRDKYGRSTFGQGCLLARRLVERGVPFVEVTLDGWDTHSGNFDRVKTLSATLDTGFAALIDDLRSRGLWEDTVILCMGEFGRTPKINGSSGRDHWPQTWSTVLAGGGIKGGQAIGKTSDDGMRVEDRKVTVPDLLATLCKSVGIDPKKQNISNVSRPIRISDPEATPIEELL